MAERISVTAADGHTLSAWKALPQGAPKGGVVVLQAIYGLTPHLGDVCDWFAEDGFAAVAPALYDRTAPGTVFGYGPDERDAAYAFRANLREDTVVADVEGCLTELRKSAARVAVSGFCTGGSWAWVCADAVTMDAAVIFYGSDVFELLDRHPRCPTVLHYGDNDHVVPLEKVEVIRDRNPDCEFHIYPGAGHAFYNPEQEHYDAAAADLTRRRTIDFLNRHLAGTG